MCGGHATSNRHHATIYMWFLYKVTVKMSEVSKLSKQSAGLHSTVQVDRKLMPSVSRATNVSCTSWGCFCSTSVRNT